MLYWIDILIVEWPTLQPRVQILVGVLILRKAFQNQTMFIICILMIWLSWKTEADMEKNDMRNWTSKEMLKMFMSRN